MVLGNGFGFWKTMPILRRISIGSALPEYMSTPLWSILPSRRKPAIKSFILFRHLKNVLLPQPDGPMMAVTQFFLISRLTSFNTRFSPYHALRFEIENTFCSTTLSSSGIYGGGIWLWSLT